MSTTTVRVLVGSVIAAGFLGIAALEVVSERVPVDLESTAVLGRPDGNPAPPAHVEDFEFREERAPSETQGAGLALLKPGDGITVEAPHGQLQRIVVLWRGWQERESPEK